MDHPIIISASRRTDIPAFYTDWFFNRIRAGHCHVPNPFNAKAVYRISLEPTDVDCIVFWTKNPAPMLSRLTELDDAGYHYYFLYTLNPYGPPLEGAVPLIDSRIAVFKKLSEHIGPDRVIWRYDPIVLSSQHDEEFHQEAFTNLARSLSGSTNRVIISYMEFYQKTKRRMRPLEQQGLVFDKEAGKGTDRLKNLMTKLSRAGKECGMEMQSCAQPVDYSEQGVKPGSCIDAQLIDKLWNIQVPGTKDPGQRRNCRCVKSRDIGMGNTCIHGCLYCYSTINHQKAIQCYNEHGPDSPSLWGHYYPAGSNDQKQVKLL